MTTTLIVSGTGKTGRRVVRRLNARGLPIRIGTPPPTRRSTGTTRPPGRRRYKASIRCTWPTSGPGVPGGCRTVGAFADLAVASGARRLVLLSGRGEEGAERGEQAVTDSGADWTLVRSSFMFQNFSESFWLEPVPAGELAFPAGEDLAEPFIDAEDIADVAVAGLTDDRHVGQLYEVTGPRLLTFAAAVAEIAKATGRTIHYVPISMDQYASALRRDGLPAALVSGLIGLFTEVLDGRNAQLADGVQRALGRQPRDFSDYAQETAASGVWGR